MNPKNAELLCTFYIFLNQVMNTKQYQFLKRLFLSIMIYTHTTFFKYIPNYKKQKSTKIAKKRTLKDKYEF